MRGISYLFEYMPSLKTMILGCGHIGDPEQNTKGERFIFETFDRQIEEQYPKTGRGHLARSARDDLGGSMIDFHTNFGHPPFPLTLTVIRRKWRRDI